MRIQLLIASFLLFSKVYAQIGGIQVNEGLGIGALMDTWINANHQGARIDGWRVQVLSTTDRQQAEQAKVRFKSLYPGVHADWTHEKPYYKLRVGAFRTRREAQTFILELKDNYPGCYPAKDPSIQPTDFIPEQ